MAVMYRYMLLGADLGRSVLRLTEEVALEIKEKRRVLIRTGEFDIIVVSRNAQGLD